MSDKVVIEGVLCSWQSSDLHVGISINGPSLQGDWTPLSGQRVRVTVDLVPEPEPRCPFCGGAVTIVTDAQHVALCRCGARGVGDTPQAALDALAEWLDVCPRCGGKAEYGRDGMLTCWYREGALPRWYVACAAPGCRIVSSHMFHTAADAAAWWNKRAARK